MIANLHNADIPRPVLDVIARLRELGHAVYLVGGCVRDMVRKVHPKDFDVATSALPEEVQRAFRKVIPTGIQHGTVTVVQGGTHVEVTTFRSEGDYLDGRRPSSVAFERDIVKDLSRRDFTINAMAYNPLDRDLVDPFGGQTDLQAHLIRCVGSAQERFSEDGLRPLRAVRFAAVLGFSLDPATRDAIPATLGVFRKVALERVREELVKLLLSPRAEGGLVLLADTGLLDVFLPEVARASAEAARLTRAAVQAAPLEIEVRLAVLLADLVDRTQARDIGLRLKFPNKVADLVALLVEHAKLEERVGEADPALRRLLARVGLAQLPQLLAVARARVSVRAPERLPEVEALAARLEALAAAKPPLSAKELALTGGDIMATLGVGPSPIVGEATRFLLDSVLDDPALNTADTLRARLKEWHARSGR
ncbi:[cytidine(C)-cytidine(C)-adenosine (A)]-adding enzyme [Pyxidicoccus fallax]|uniref:[cytidine(C)-cytidine(C)-adenosine (A)]-adding enzyme n=1 Tax=Pyxidicoccus fallax TaxID=394095 RepID=A0A848LF51_9BACT|nr:[cytidine(C)-cytidine(C)-adenosine (A)]-adding enzyme [Pyxidicoccus fallax]NMO15495.1 [cytidine(C)-cytidine(C)-adenosine (A)]-adding enzyme [Pyxidicoccus fallax]NPC80337.1 [cytidine(C)-cytidine(C)-adenosine (A)]-adding enzyme [Pyxidicoccus fallax]